MILADSIGFAATHTISSILAEIPDAEVRHGSRNFEKGGPVGIGDTSPVEFLDAMKRSRKAGRRPYAVHCLFPPAEGKVACRLSGATHKLIVREPSSQIRSCYSWMLRKLLRGDEILFKKLAAIEPQFLAKVPVRSTLANAAFANAMMHVVGYNIAALEAGCEILQMERLVSDEAYFRASFDVPEDAVLSHFAGDAVHRASHRKQIEGIEIADPEEENLLQIASWEVRGESISVAGLARLLGYD